MGGANVVLLDDQRTALWILEMQPNVLSLLSKCKTDYNSGCIYTLLKLYTVKKLSEVVA